MKFNLISQSVSRFAVGAIHELPRQNQHELPRQIATATATATATSR